MAKHLRHKKVKNKPLKIGDKVWFRKDFLIRKEEYIHISEEPAQMEIINFDFFLGKLRLIINGTYGTTWYIHCFSRTKNGPPLTVKDFNL
jgi:hypothetical protein